MREAVIVAAARTPVGRCRGALASVPVEELGAIACREAVKRSGVDPKEIDEVIFSNLMGHNINNMGRMVALQAGLPITVPGISLDRQCGASLTGFAYATMAIQTGFADVMVAGGVESDSRRTYTMDKPTAPYQVMPPQWSNIVTCPPEYGQDSMVVTADNLAEKYNLTREECDAFAVESHRRADAAQKAGYFDSQIVPVEIRDRKGSYFVDKDECVRADSTLETLGKLGTVQRGAGHYVTTAGNSSPMSDGAGAVVVMEKQKALSMGLEIMGTMKAYASTGVEPRIMGIGPYYATKKLLEKSGMTLGDIDLIEMNEAFAAQSLAVLKEIDFDRDKLNVNGGAIALGHPLAGTGAVLLTKMLYELKRRDLSTGLVTFCCGGGMGVSVVIER